MEFDNSLSITDVVQVLVAIVNVFLVWLVYRLTKKDINPKLYIKPIQRKHNTDYEPMYDRNVNRGLDEIDFEQRGFPESSLFHDSIIWELEIHNNSEFPAHDVVLDYEIIVKKVDIDFGIDEADVIEERYIPYHTIKRSFELDYLAPSDKKVIKVLYLIGKFTKADLIVNKLESKEGKYIDKSILIDTYEHPEFEKLTSSYHHRCLIGAHKEPK